MPGASVDWTVDADIGERARGIYKARLYTARASTSGTVAVLGVSDALGIRAAPDITVAGRAHAFSPGSGDAATSGGLHAPLAYIDLAKGETLDFSLSGIYH